jgi:benzylsuccinate CoA-transferase BbsE subunit
MRGRPADPDKGEASLAPTGPLAPYRVLDLTGELGWLCGRILADLGADVIKVEPPGGDPGRARPPFIEGPTGEALASAWLAYNAGKRGVTLDLASDGGRDQLLRLAKEADFLVESFPPGRLADLALGWESLHALNARLVMTSITPFGQAGPDAAAPATDLELMAAGGAVWLAGDEDRPPVRVSHPQAYCWASAYAAVGTLIAHHHRQQTGRGQHVDVSAQAAIVPMLVQAPNFWEMLGVNPERSGPFLPGRNVHGAKLRNIWPCRDGYVTFAIYGGAAGRHSNRQLVAWMHERGVAPPEALAIDWEEFEVATAPADQLALLESAIAPFLLSLSKREFLEGALARRLLGYLVSTAEDIALDPQLVARDAWQDLADPALGLVLRHPTGVFRFDGQPNRLRRPAPQLGEHNRDLLGDQLEAALSLSPTDERAGWGVRGGGTPL